MRSSYTLSIANSPDGQSFALVRDQDHGLSVTNDAENVVVEVLARHRVDRIIYRDTEGRWDELRHDGSKFTDFAPIKDRAGLWVVENASRIPSA